MRRIKAIRELEEIIAIHKPKGYMVRLNYRLLPPKRPQYGENGLPVLCLEDSPENPLQQEDLRSRSNTWMTIGALQFKD